MMDPTWKKRYVWYEHDESHYLIDGVFYRFALKDCLDGVRYEVSTTPEPYSVEVRLNEDVDVMTITSEEDWVVAILRFSCIDL